MKRNCIYLLGTAVMFFSMLTNLKAQSQEQIERFNEERKTYFNKELELTDAECKAFWPLYEDFQNRKMKLVEDERNTWNYAHKNADNLSESEIQETLRKGYNLREEQLDLEEEYYTDKFLEALPARKVLKLGKVEWDFRRYLLRKLRDDGDRDRGQGGGSGRSSDEPFPYSSHNPYLH